MKFNLAHNTNKNSAWTYETVPNHTSGDNSTKPGAKKLIAGNIMSAVQKAQRLTPSHRRKKKSKIIEELKIFDAELEAQPEFNGFTDLFPAQVFTFLGHNNGLGHGDFIHVDS